MATKTAGQTQIKGNHRNIYTMPTCYYMNFQAAGHVYREAFSFRKLGGKSQALKHAVFTRDLLEANRKLIVDALKAIEAAATKPDSDRDITKLLKAVYRKAVVVAAVVVPQ